MPTPPSQFLTHWPTPFHALHLPTPDPTPLLTLYTEPHRHYHNLTHILDCLTQLEAFFAAPPNPLQSKINPEKPTLQLALLYHDAIYNPRANDNEHQSAQLAQQHLAPLLPPTTLANITRLIQITDHKSPPTRPDEQLILDIDLSILGSPPPIFAAYESNIRLEYAHVPDPTFRQARAKILTHFLSRPTLYHTPHFHTRYHAQSRLNITHSIAQLTT